MAVKNLSTRAQICGRGGGCHGGHSAVEQSAYISRDKMYSEYDGQMYYPKYSEDLVYKDVLLPENAQEEYKDPSVLWNSVEMNEKSSNAQLARTFRFSLPNEWSYEYAKEFVEAYAMAYFVSHGMCVQYAIHDSEKNGQRNLHCHMMMTMRGIDENGNWMPKQKKEYLTDENGERIPLIDKSTGLQKVDKNNRKQWKCKTIPTNDWSSKDKVKYWRAGLAKCINDYNEMIGRTENFWEHRSFSEQGLDILPQVHLGEKATALERKGIHTEKGDHNREIMEHNKVIMLARHALDKAMEELEAVRAIPVTVFNEIIDMIHKVCERNNNRLKMPIFKGQYIAKVFDRNTLLDKAYMERFVHENGWTTFEEMNRKQEEMIKENDRLEKRHDLVCERIKYLEGLIDMYDQYEPYIKFNKEYWSLKEHPVRFKMYGKQHNSELTYFRTYRSLLKGMIKEDDKTIAIGKWRKELAKLYSEADSLEGPITGLNRKLAAITILQFNKKDLERMLQNERHEIARESGRYRSIPER